MQVCPRFIWIFQRNFERNLFAEAHKIKLKADNLEAFELEKMRNQHQMRLSNVVEKFKTKQTAEILALRKRVQTVSSGPARGRALPRPE